MTKHAANSPNVDISELKVTLIKEHEEKLKTLRNNLEDKERELLEAKRFMVHQKDIVEVELQNKLIEKQKIWNKNMIAQLELQKRELLNTHNIELKNKDEIIHNMSTSIKSQLQNKHDVEIAYLKSQQETIINKYNNEIKNKDDIIESLKANLTNVKTDVNNIRAQLELQLKEQLELQHKININKYNNEIKNKDDIIESLKNDLTNFKSLHNSNIESQIQERLEVQQKIITNKYIVDLKNKDDVIESLKTNIANSVALYNSTIEKLKAQVEFQQKNMLTMYNSDLKNKDDMIDRLKANIADINAFNKSKVDSLEEQLKNIEIKAAQKYDEKYKSEKQFLLNEMEIYKDQCRQLKHYNDNLKLDLQRDKEKYEQELKRDNDRYLQELNNKDKTMSLLASIRDALPQQQYISTTQKGKDGEDKVEQLLKNKYYDAVIENTANETARGDFYFKWKKLKCLIEVKNKSKLSQDDMTKFARDIEESINSQNGINCAIFVSLHTSHFPKRSQESFQLDIIHGIRVIYIHMEHEIVLYNAITLLDVLLSAITDDSEELQHLKSYFINYYNYIKNEYDFLEKLIKDKKKELTHLQSRYNSIGNIANSLGQSYNKYANIETQTVPTESEVKEIEKQPTFTIANTISIHNIAQPLQPQPQQPPQLKTIIDSFKTYYVKLREGNIAVDKKELLAYLNIPETTLDLLGGYNKLVKDTITDYVNKHVTMEIRSKLNELRAATGVFPNRKTVIAKKILSDTTLRKLSCVIGGTENMRIMTYIEQICDKVQHSVEDPINDSDVVNAVNVANESVEDLNEVDNS